MARLWLSTGSGRQAGMTSWPWVPVPVDGRPPPSMRIPHRAIQRQIHVFWSCPVAAAVRNSVASALPSDTQIPCSALWLLQAPPGINREV